MNRQYHTNLKKSKKIGSEVVYPELSYKLNGILFMCHNNLGRYRTEKEYGDFLEKALKDHSIVFEREKALPPSFEGEQPRRNIVDFLIENKIILDLKAKLIISKDDYFQMQRYLKAFNCRLGIIVNFRQKYLRPKRIINKDFVQFA